jgi:hypothetical protein
MDSTRRQPPDVGFHSRHFSLENFGQNIQVDISTTHNADDTLPFERAASRRRERRGTRALRNNPAALDEKLHSFSNFSYRNYNRTGEQ